MLRTVLAGMILGSVLATAALAAETEPPNRPFLRVETGLHTAVINRLALDSTRRLVATAADDQTIRVWNTEDGSLLRTLRVPLDVGVGAMYAVALAPDGKRLFATGATGLWDGAPVMYLYDIEAQKLLARLKLPNTANHLAYSPDGRLVAAGLFGRGGGLRTWDAATGKPAFQDTAYSDRVTWVAFDRSGRIATAAWDGAVRLYAPDGTLLARRTTTAGTRPHSVAFSPAGDLLAVGFFDRPAVEVLAGKDLTLRHSPDVKTLRGGNLAAVAWLGTGRDSVLAAGGSATDQAGRMILRKWPANGTGAPVDVPVARDSISQIEAMPEGAALVASADPAWSVIAAGGARTLYRGGGIGDFRDSTDGRFALSADGLTIEFGMAKGGRDPHAFNFRDRRYGRSPEPDRTLAEPITSGRRLTVDGWKNATRPSVGRRVLALDAAERSLSLAMAADERRFVLGTDYHLRLYDAAGTPLAAVEVPGAAWGVAIARDAPLAVAALGDGTLRWYSLIPGRELEELAALFPHPDGRRWVAWTPEALFDHADLGGKELVGFHLNQGRGKAPTWVDFAQAYKLYYAPELVLAKLEGTAGRRVAERLAQIGDVRDRLTQRPLPQIQVAEYCFGNETTRGLRRLAPGQAGPAPVTTTDAGQLAGTGGIPLTGTPPQSLASPVGGGEVCRPVERVPLTRGLARLKPASATAPTGTGDSGATVGTGEVPSFTAALPPGSQAIRLRVKLIDQGGGLGAIDIFLNNRNIGRDTTRGLARLAPGSAPTPGAAPVAGIPTSPTPGPGPAPVPVEIERVIPLDPGTNRIAVRAYEATNTLFERSPMIEFVAEVPPPPPVAANAPPPAPPSKPTLHLLTIAIDQYRAGGISPLAFPVADSKAFVSAIRQRSAPLYDRIEVTELYDQKATKAAARAALTSIAGKAANTDTVLIYLAGHGYADDQLPYHFITADVDRAAVDEVTRQALAADDLVQLLATIPARNTFLFLDTCHAGAVPNFGAVTESAGNIAHEAGRYLLAASASDQEARDSFNQQNGLMAYALLRGIEGGARNADGVVDSVTLGLFAKREIEKLNRSLNQTRGQAHRQRALFKLSSDDLDPFPLARVE